MQNTETFFARECLLLCRLGSSRITATLTQSYQHSIVFFLFHIWTASYKSCNTWSTLFRCLYAPPRRVLYRHQVPVHQSSTVTALQTTWPINSKYRQVKPFYQVNICAWYSRWEILVPRATLRSESRFLLLTKRSADPGREERLERLRPHEAVWWRSYSEIRVVSLIVCCKNNIITVLSFRVRMGRWKKMCSNG